MEVSKNSRHIQRQAVHTCMTKVNASLLTFLGHHELWRQLCPPLPACGTYSAAALSGERSPSSTMSTPHTSRFVSLQEIRPDRPRSGRQAGSHTTITRHPPMEGSCPGQLPAVRAKQALTAPADRRVIRASSNATPALKKPTPPPQSVAQAITHQLATSFTHVH